MNIQQKFWLFTILSMLITTVSLGFIQTATFFNLRDKIINEQTEEMYQSVLGIANDMDMGLQPLMAALRNGAALSKSFQESNSGFGKQFVVLTAQLTPIDEKPLPSWFEAINYNPDFRMTASKALGNLHQRFTYFTHDKINSQFPNLMIFWLFPDINRAFGELIPTDQVRIRIQYLQQEHNRSFQSMVFANILTIVLIALIQGFGSALLIRRLFIRPIKILQASMEGLATGNADMRWKSQSKDEFHHLGMAFNSMADQLTNYSQRLENVVSERNIELEQLSRRMAWGSQMAAEVAHDIKSPLGSSLMAISAIQNSRQELQGKFDSNTMTKSDFNDYLSSSKDLLNIVEIALNKTVDLTNGFKEIVVDQIGDRFRKINLPEYLDDVVLCMRPLIRKKKINVRVIYPTGLTIETDPGGISQIFTNLIQNSLSHGFSDPPKANGEISIKVYDPVDGKITIEYSDNGNGMSPEIQARIFEPMFTTKRGSGGTGLGMGIIKNLVSGHLGGTIAVSSSPGNGSTFTISIPLAHNSPENGNHTD